MSNSINSSRVSGEVVSLEGDGKTFPLTGVQSTIGRERGCDIILSYPDISHQHCELLFRGDILFVRDLKSKNGVKINGTKISATTHRVDSGDILSLGKHRFHIRY